MFYDFYASRYENGAVTAIGSALRSRYARKVCEAIVKSKGGGLRVLEVGPGVGHVARHLSSHGFDYIGLEGNQTLVSRLATNYKVIQSIVPPFPVKNEAFDVVVADQVVEHMPTFREAIDFLSECRRVLAKSGMLVLGFPDYIRTGCIFYDQDYTHSFMTTESRIDQILRDVGFNPYQRLRFTGPVTFPVMRLVLDLVMLSLNSRLACLVLDTCGLTGLVYRLRKTLGASTIVYSRNDRDCEKVTVRSKGRLTDG